MNKMRKCVVCFTYTFKAVHCENHTISAHPAPFKPKDKYLVLKGEFNERNRNN